MDDFTLACRAQREKEQIVQAFTRTLVTFAQPGKSKTEG
jgi:hypothetical protein